MTNKLSKPSRLLEQELGLVDDVPRILQDSRAYDNGAEESAHPSRIAHKRRWNSFCWGAGGFIAGALFWHSIGFWSFIQTTLVPTPDSRRAERETINSDARLSSNTTSPSPVRPLRNTAKIAGRHEATAQPGSTVATIAPPHTPPPTPSGQEAAGTDTNCTVIARAKDGLGGAIQTCTSVPLPLIEGKGLQIADKQPVKAGVAKSTESAKAALLVWQAKVEVAPEPR
jgi:hypothetical protein